MSKEEFLTRLREALMGEMNDIEIQSNISYYQSYITEEVKNGRTEQEVVDELGEPRLIARTIIDTSASASNRSSQAAYSGSEEDQNQNSGHYRKVHFGFGHMKWYTKLLIFVVILTIILGIVSIVGSIVSFFLPVLLPMLIIFLIITMINGRKG